MVLFYTLREWQNDCLGSRLVKFYQTQILGVANCWAKTIIILRQT